MLAPPHSLHLLLCRWCWQMLAPPHSLHLLLCRWCWQRLDPPHSLQLFLRRWCSHKVCFNSILESSCVSRSFLCRLFVLPLFSAAARVRFLFPTFPSTLAALQLLGSAIDREMVSDVDLAVGSCGAYRSTCCFARRFLKLPWKAACSGISPTVEP